MKTCIHSALHGKDWTKSEWNHLPNLPIGELACDLTVSEHSIGDDNFKQETGG